MIKENVFERYGLRANPFHSRSDNRLEEVSRCHVDVALDKKLAEIKQSIFSKQKNEFVILIGTTGMGKTERLFIAEKEAAINNLLSVHITFHPECTNAMKLLLDSLAPKASTLFSNDKVDREIAKVKGKVEKGYDARTLGKLLGEVFSKKNPIFLLFDDIHFLASCHDRSDFIDSLAMALQKAAVGVFVLCTAQKDASRHLFTHYPLLKTMMTHGLEISPLSSAEAEEIIKKRLDVHRIVDAMSGLFPFSSEAIASLNTRAKGNPSFVLSGSSILLTAAAFQKGITISDQFQQDTFQELRGKPWFSEDTFSVIPQQIPQNHFNEIKKKGFFSRKPVSPAVGKKPSPSPSFSKQSIFSPSSKDNGSKQKKYQSLMSPAELNHEVRNDQIQAPSLKDQVDDPGNEEISLAPEKLGSNPAHISESSHNLNSDINDLYDLEMSHLSDIQESVPLVDQSVMNVEPGDKGSDTNKKLSKTITEKKKKKKIVKQIDTTVKPKTSISSLKPVMEKDQSTDTKHTIRCPKCEKIFQTKLDPSMTKLTCPHCAFSRAFNFDYLPSTSSKKEKENVKMIRVKCPDCDHVFHHQDDRSYQPLVCPHCGFSEKKIRSPHQHVQSVDDTDSKPLVEVSCPSCHEGFSTRFDQSDRTIICPHCHYTATYVLKTGNRVMLIKKK